MGWEQLQCACGSAKPHCWGGETLNEWSNLTLQAFWKEIVKLPKTACVHTVSKKGRKNRLDLSCTLDLPFVTWLLMASRVTISSLCWKKQRNLALQECSLDGKPQKSVGGDHCCKELMQHLEVKIIAKVSEKEISFFQISGWNNCAWWH